VSREEALAAYTANAAYAGFAEGRFGRLVKGERADFLLLDTDPLMATPTRVARTMVLQTWVNGQLVHQHQEPDPAEIVGTGLLLRSGGFGGAFGRGLGLGFTALAQPHHHQRAFEQQPQRDQQQHLRARRAGSPRQRSRSCHDHIAPRRNQLRPADDPGAVEQQQQHRQQKADPEGENELHHQPQIVTGARQRLDVEAALLALERSGIQRNAVGITT
jgi:hypothetical protein